MFFISLGIKKNYQFMIMSKNGCNVVPWKCYKHNHHLRNEFGTFITHELYFFWKWTSSNIAFLLSGTFGIVTLLADDKCSCCRQVTPRRASFQAFSRPIWAWTQCLSWLRSTLLSGILAFPQTGGCRIDSEPRNTNIHAKFASPPSKLHANGDRLL